MSPRTKATAGMADPIAHSDASKHDTDVSF
jgi:hypothetical protein